MASIIHVTCPQCGKQIKAPETVFGKRVRCKFCQAAFTAGKEQAKKPPDKAVKPAAKPAPAKPAKPSDDDDDNDPNPYGLESINLAPRCPDCANDMEEGDIICLTCGYNTQTRQRYKTLKTFDNTTGEKFVWLLPGIVCAIVVLSVIGFNIWFLRVLPKMIDASENTNDPWYLTMWVNGGFQTWVVIVSIFIVFFCGRFAIKRLILHYSRPEVEKLK